MIYLPIMKNVNSTLEEEKNIKDIISQMCILIFDTFIVDSVQFLVGRFLFQFVIIFLFLLSPLRMVNRMCF